MKQAIKQLTLNLHLSPYLLRNKKKAYFFNSFMSWMIDWINSSLKEADGEAFKDVVKVTDAQVEPLGDGQLIFISEINRATITMETSSGEKRSIKVIVKVEAPPGTGLDLANTFGAFPCEINMYSNVLKYMKSLMKEAKDEEIPWPHCYLSLDNKFLIEDLCEKHYKVVPTSKLLDLNHSMLVMKMIGTFHGLSMVMMERGALDVTKFRKPLITLKDPMWENLQRNSLDSLVGVIRDTWGPEWSSVPDRLLKYFDNGPDKFNELWESTKGKWDVLNHGDFSMRNMLFHYPAESSTPDGVKFVDFQTCHYSNLGFDVSSLLYGSMIPSVRKENMTALLTEYTDNLSATCKKCNYTGSIPSLKDVTESLESLQHHNMCFELFNLPFFMSSNKKDSQERATKFIDTFTTEEASDISIIDYSDEQVDSYFKSVLNEYMENKIF